MASTFTTRARYNKQGSGDNINTWGDTILNAQCFDRIDETINGFTIKAISGNVTLTSVNGLADEARMAVLEFTDGGLSTAPTITIPGSEKTYWVDNTALTFDVIISTGGGDTATVRAGRTSKVICDGTNCAVVDPSLDEIKPAAADVDLNSQKITSLADGTATADATNKGQLDAVASGLLSSGFAAPPLHP